jgi:hypothetical protein
MHYDSGGLTGSDHAVLFGGPAVAHARQLKGLGLYAEDLSRRDSVTVAQYEVLGNDAKRHVRPVRDDRNVRLLVSHAAQGLPALVDRPVRDG